MALTVKNNIRWVGKTDWELKKFHGDEYSTHQGSTYNSFLLTEEKTVLIDTVWQPFAKEFVRDLAALIDLKKIDFIVANHGEVDHSGALSELLRAIPGTPVYCTANAVKSLKGHYHEDWNFKVVKTGDSLEVGNGKKLVFVEAPMLHWPDTMTCYLTGDAVFFSNDIFGQHYCTGRLWDDLSDQGVLEFEAMKYYANIITPFSPLVKKKIDQILALKLPIDMICPSHGVLWRTKHAWIIEKYLAWTDNYRENRITVAYDTMWNGTRVLAEHIGKGILEADPSVAVALCNLAKSDKNDVITDLFRSKGLFLGSPTINKGILTSVASFLEETKGLQFKGKKAAAFGAYGWSGESPKLLSKALAEAGFEVVGEPLSALWNPDADARARAVEFGRALAAAMH